MMAKIITFLFRQSSRAVESEIPTSDSGLFQLSDSNYGSAPTFSCFSYSKR